MFHFSLKDLFVATALVAIGLVGWLVSWHMYWLTGEAGNAYLAFWGLASNGFVAIIGAGLGLPFRQKITGAILLSSLWLALLNLGFLAPGS